MSVRCKGVALIGYGLVGATYADALGNLADSVQLTGVLGRSATSGRAFLGKHPELGCSRVYGSIAEIAGDLSVDFVIVTTPPDARDLSNLP